MDLKIDRETGDLVFINGACPVTEDFTDSTAQRVYIMLRTFEGEWYLNISTGIPYYPTILGTKVSKTVIDRIIQQKVLEVQGVADIVSFESSINSDRVYECQMKIRDIGGEIFTELLRGDEIA